MTRTKQRNIYLSLRFLYGFFFNYFFSKFKPTLVYIAEGCTSFHNSIQSQINVCVYLPSVPSWHYNALPSGVIYIYNRNLNIFTFISSLIIPLTFCCLLYETADFLIFNSNVTNEKCWNLLQV